MRCPKCDSENSDSAKFCKKCGTPLKKNVVSNDNSMGGESGGSNSTKYVIVALIIVVIVLAGVFVYLYGFGTTQSIDSQNTDASNAVADVSSDEAQSSSSSSSQPESMSIKSGSFQTGGALEDKTYASIYVGSEHAGEDVTIQIFYSRDGSTLNDGNMVPITVDSSGYINVNSADAYKYFPDHAEINLFDSSGSTLLDTKSVSLSPQSGTQTF